MTAKPDRSQGRIRSHDLALALVSGLCLGFAWPGRGPSVLAIFFLVPFFAATRSAPAGRRALLAWLAGSVAAGISAAGATAATLAAYFELSGVGLVLAAVAAHQLLGALPFVLFGLLVGDVERPAPWRAFVHVGSVWVVSEAFRALLFPGAWLSLASTLARSPSWLQSAGWIGEVGVSFWIAGLGVLVYRGLLGPDRRNAWRWAIGVVALLSLQGVSGEATGAAAERVEVEGPTTAASDGLRVALVQSGVDSRMRTGPPSDARDLARLVDLSLDSGRGADLLVWPEGAVRGIWPANAGSLDRNTLARLEVEHLLLGAPWMEDPMHGGPLGVAAVLVDSEARIEGRHRKTRLVPIAEDRRVWTWLRTDGPGAGFAPGAAAAPLAIGSIPIGVSICYEVLFNSLARQQALAGAEILVQLSNESWLGESMQGRDHMLAAAVLRAIEVRRPVVRATTTGHTAAIDARGRIVAKLPPGSPGVLRVHVTPTRGTTPFARIGPTPIVAACLAWTAIGLAIHWRRVGRGNRIDRGRARAPTQ